MAVDQNPCCCGPPPLLQTFVAGPLLQTLVADHCVEYGSLQGACRGGFVAEDPRLLQTFVAKWPYKPATRPMFFIRCHIAIAPVAMTRRARKSDCSKVGRTAQHKRNKSGFCGSDPDKALAQRVQI